MGAMVEFASVTTIGTVAGFTPAYCWICDLSAEMIPEMPAGALSIVARSEAELENP